MKCFMLFGQIWPKSRSVAEGTSRATQTPECDMECHERPSKAHDHGIREAVHCRQDCQKFLDVTPNSKSVVVLSLRSQRRSGKTRLETGALVYENEF